MNMEVITARWVLDLLPSEEIPKVATEALVEGFDTPSLRILAGFNNPISSEIKPIFEKALRELQIANSSREEAALILSRYYAQQIINGIITPYEGASKIWREAAYIVRPNITTLDAFIYWADEFKESNNAARRKECEIAIVESARALLKDK